MNLVVGVGVIVVVIMMVVFGFMVKFWDDGGGFVLDFIKRG